MILLDGPMGSELGRRGVPTPAPTWSADALDVAPDIIRAIHADYARAGAEVHRTNTFRAQPKLYPERWRELVGRAVSLAREGAASAASGRARIAGVIAPIEDCYRPDLSPPRDLARRAHRAMAEALRDAAVDLIVCETFAHGGEAAIAVEEATRTGLETWAALTAGPDGTLLSPERLEDAARACASAGATALLVNCTSAPLTLRYLDRLTRIMIRIGAYGNAGADWGNAGQDAVERYVAHVGTWVEAGATIIGSCCGTGPEHTAALARKLRDL